MAIVIVLALAMLTACNIAPQMIASVPTGALTSTPVPVATTARTASQISAPTAQPTRTTLPTLATPASSALPAVFMKFLSHVQIELEGEFIMLKSNGAPPHPSPYFPKTDSRYQAYNGTNPNYRQNPNQIREQSLALQIPLNPRQDSRHMPTPLGPIGMALDGVALFNQYAGPNQPLTFEINGFDQFNGHPEQQGLYHYHLEPLFLSARFGKDVLIGFLLDGLPVYGPQENGKTITNRDLDAYHGHAHATVDYPNGVYHYHVTADAPYINGTGFYGTPGRVVR